MTDQDIRYERAGALGIITLNRPDVLNAFRRSMFPLLIDLLRKAAADPVRVLILTGEGRAFSAGIDLKEFSAAQASDSEDTLRAHLREVQDVTRNLVEHPKVVIVAVNGLAIGLGAEIAVAGDIRIATEDASFGFPEATRGVFHTNGITLLLPRLVGTGRAMEWLATGRTIDANEALQAGLINHAVPAGQLMDKARELADVIAANAPNVVRLVKRFVRRGYHVDLDQRLDEEIDGVVSSTQNPSFMEGMAGFLERRSANRF